MDTDAIIMLALVTAVVLVIALLSMITSSKKYDNVREVRESTDFLDGSQLKCGICFGVLDGAIAVCRCGRRFHDSCAEPTGSCPYCDSEYGTFDVFAGSRMRCPNCGRYPLGNICGCGAVFPRNGRFLCVCGESLDEGDTVCRACGAAYVMKEG